MTTVDISEQALSDQVHHIARLYGWRSAHFRTAPNCRGRYSTPVAYEGVGFPDLVLVHPLRQLVLFRELKRDRRSHVSSEQTGWLNDLRSAGADAGIWYPSSWGDIVAQLSDGQARLA